MQKNVVWQWLVVLAFLTTLGINGLANALPLNGLTTGEISDRFPIYFVPAGYVFSIWAIIYLGLGAFALQALPAQKENPRLAAARPLFVASCIANISWLFAWHFEQFVLSLFLMVALLISLVAVYVRLETGRNTVPPGEHWLVRVPFSVYLGWITVATIGNVTTVLYDLQWNGWGFSPEAWAVIMLVVAGGLSAVVALRRRDAAYLLVLVWALAGIGVKHSAVGVVAGTAWVAAAVVAILALASLVRDASQLLESRILDPATATTGCVRFHTTEK